MLPPLLQRSCVCVAEDYKKRSPCNFIITGTSFFIISGISRISGDPPGIYSLNLSEFYGDCMILIIRLLYGMDNVVISNKILYAQKRGGSRNSCLLPTIILSIFASE